MLDVLPEAEDKYLLTHWFYRDDNSIPPVYVLQPITVHLPYFNDNSDANRRRDARKAWWEQFETMQVLLRQAASKTLGKSDAAKYFISGITKVDVENNFTQVI